MTRKVLFYGDSNTYGYDPAGYTGGRYPAASRWTSILQQNLRGAWQVLADGFPGRSIPASEGAWEYLRSVVRQAMPLDLFAVMLGTNDILGTLHPDAAETARRMNDLLSFVEEAAADALPADPVPADLSFPGVPPRRRRFPQLFLVAPPKFRLSDQPPAEPYAPEEWTYERMYEEEGRKLTQYYREIAEKRGIWFADASEWELDLAFDGVHLSIEGNVAFASMMTQALREIQRWS